MEKKGIIIWNIIVIIISGFMSAGQGNSAPEVRILEPQKPYFNWNSPIPYRLQVTDKEDGSSAYEEIAPAEVFLMVRYLDDSARLNSLLAEIKKSEPVLMLLKKNQCFNCHSVKSKLAGPSFESIIGRYRSNPSNLSYLANKIVQGSKGVWGDSQQMPSHPDIKEGEAKAIAQWIDRNASEPGFDYLPGLEGTLRLPAPFQKNNKGVYVLLASYTDHGIEGKNGKTANQVLVLHPLR